jgi:tetratricopeptide (TPR) repeat protein
MNVGTAYRRLGLGNDARAAYARARELAEAGVVKNPRSGYGRSVIAYASARLGDMRRAENEIAQAVQLSPDDTNVLRMAVKTYEALGRREESLGILRRSPAEVGSDLARFPDLAELQRDPRFQSLITKLANEESTRR